MKLNARVATMSDKIRILRVIEYVGDREAVERQVAASIHGEKKVITSFGENYTIKAATIGIYPEILDSIGVDNGINS